MIRRLTPATAVDVLLVEAALFHLRRARRDLRLAGCPQAAAKVARAIKSTEGALRHAHRRVAETEDGS